MASKKDDVTTYTKAELIKALRASVAREAKLQKKYDGLLDQLAKRPKAAGAVTDRLPPAPPAFPWDVE